MKLYEIDAAIADVIERGYSFDEETGEVFFSAADLDELEADRADKLEACAIVMKEMDAEAAAMVAEEKHLKERRQRVERKRARLRDYVAHSMMLAGETSFDTPRASMSFRRSTAVDITDTAALPPEYVVEVTDKRPDKMAIKWALQDGQEIEGATLVVRDNLQVK